MCCGRVGSSCPSSDTCDLQITTQKNKDCAHELYKTKTSGNSDAPKGYVFPNATRGAIV